MKNRLSQLIASSFLIILLMSGRESSREKTCGSSMARRIERNLCAISNGLVTLILGENPVVIEVQP